MASSISKIWPFIILLILIASIESIARLFPLAMDQALLTLHDRNRILYENYLLNKGTCHSTIIGTSLTSTLTSENKSSTCNLSLIGQGFFSILELAKKQGDITTALIIDIDSFFQDDWQFRETRTTALDLFILRNLHFTRRANNLYLRLINFIRDHSPLPKAEHHLNREQKINHRVAMINNSMKSLRHIDRRFEQFLKVLAELSDSGRNIKVVSFDYQTPSGNQEFDWYRTAIIKEVLHRKIPFESISVNIDSTTDGIHLLPTARQALFTKLLN